MGVSVPVGAFTCGSHLGAEPAQAAGSLHMFGIWPVAHHVLYWCFCCRSWSSLREEEGGGDDINKKISLYKEIQLHSLTFLYLIFKTYQYIKKKLKISWTNQQHFRTKGFTIKQAGFLYKYVWSVLAASGVASLSSSKCVQCSFHHYHFTIFSNFCFCLYSCGIKSHLNVMLA